MSLARTLRTSCFAAALAAFVGCAGPTFVVQQYDGSPRPRETIAIIRVKGDESVRLVALDGANADAPLDSDVRLHVEVLPGEHTLHVANAASPEQPVQRIAFRAEPGRTYHVFFVRFPSGVRPADDPLARVYEVWADSDSPLRDVTLAKSEDAPERPSAR